MLALRVATALVLIPIVLLALFKFPTYWFAILFGIVCLLGAYEWSTIRGSHHVILSVVLLAAGSLAYWMPTLLPWFAFAGTIWWVWCAYSLSNPDSVSGHSGLKIVHGLLTLLPAWCALVYLHSHGTEGRATIFCILLIVWGADTFAYFAGKQWGKRKLAPTISPGKSVEGAIGGIIGVLIVAVVSGMAYWQFGAWELSVWLVLCVITAVISIVGDLCESKLKRAAGVKDSGNLLPGHGGMLDRIDSMLAAAPVFTTGLILSGLLSFNLTTGSAG